VKRTTSDVEIIKKTFAHVGGPDKKKESKAIRALRKFSPEKLLEAGLDPTKFPPSDTTRVFRYGTAGRMYSPTENIEQEMRARHEFYNSVVRAARPVLEQYNRIVDGPQQQALRKVNGLVDAKYDAIREINKNARKIVKNPAVDALLTEINALRAERKPLFPLSKKERQENAKVHKAVLDLMDKELSTTTLKALRNARPADLWHGNYNGASDDFKTAWKRVKLDGTKLHLRYEFNGEAENILTTKYWNGEGVLSSSHSGQIGKKRLKTEPHWWQRWGNIVAGGSPYLKVRKLTRDDLAVHGLRDSYRIDERHYLASIKLRDGWVSLPVFLHRVPKPMDRIVESSFIVQKEGFKRKTYFLLTVCFTAENPTGTDQVQITPAWERQPDGKLLVARYVKNRVAGEFFLPSDNRSEHAGELDGYVIKHLAAINDERIKRGLLAEKRNTLRHIYRSTVLVAKDGDVRDNLRAVFAKMRDIEAVHGKYAGGDATLYVDLVMEEVGKRFTFSSKSDVDNFTTAMIFTQNYQHLYPWAERERRKSLAARKECYRILAKKLLTGAASVVLPDKDYRARNMSEDQKSASPSELVHVVENFAQRNGIAVHREERERAVAVGAS
jgi:hypothetical protein